MRALVVALLLFVLVGCQSARYNLGDTVCFKQNGKKGTVKWYVRDTRRVTYTVISVNDLNQVYEVNVLEWDLEPCK